jgi:2-polyprenyl-6-methoxyphenol hydroxylase-like FAD-dependent oxidoreductase
MIAQRRAEIAGAGFAGLTAACALAQRGWRVRVHERSDQLRTTGAGIYVYENGLRVLEAVGAYAAATAGAPIADTREVRDDRNRTISVHQWRGSRVFSIVRQRIINALGDVASRAGVDIVFNSQVVGADSSGELLLHDGRRVKADLVIGADGTNSRVRDALDLLAKRKRLVDGATRLLIDKTAEERATQRERATTIEYWSGSRRMLYTPCSESDIYIALTMLNRDSTATSVPLNKTSWVRSFPHLETLINRIGSEGRYDPFELIKLKRWSRGKVAIIGDAAHALPPNIGQGGGCAMMNALALAVYLERYADTSAALDAWEAEERPLTDHTQRISLLLGWPTTWPPKLRSLAFKLSTRSKWLMHQRTRMVYHRPTGT